MLEEPSKEFLRFINLLLNVIYLAASGLSSPHVGSSSPTKDGTWTPCVGSAES